MADPAAHGRSVSDLSTEHQSTHPEYLRGRRVSSAGNLQEILVGSPGRTAGLIGKADIVEFHRLQDGTWQPFPVEYKRGKPKADDCDKVQLCAQALCLEEMLNAGVLKGALFYGKTRRRLDVSFDEKLRQKTEETARNVRILLDSGRTPPPVYTKKCESCSLVGECLPKTMGKRRSVKSYLSRILGEP
jgi:CRISPR-associated exonuclease Cas4